MTGPLNGVRVLDISRFMAGPYAGQLFAYLGAEVIKVEDPSGGDPIRSLSKHSLGGFSSHFLAGNSGKKSLTLDLRSKEGRAVFLQLVEQSDIVIENMRPGVLSRLQLDYATLKQCNRRIVLASITGFGQTGPLRGNAAYDLIAQAISGTMSMTGWPGAAPAKMGVPIADLGAGIFAALGALAALYRAKTSGTGEWVDISMMDVQLSSLNYHAHAYWISGEEPQAEGDGHPNIVPYQSFDTAAGRLVVAVYGDPFWPGFCRALELPELLADPSYSSNGARHTNKDRLVRLLETQFARHPREYWLERLRAHGIPAAPLNTVGQALRSPQAEARAMAVRTSDAMGTTFELLGNPIKLESGTLTPTAPPHLGQHTDQLLADLLGYDDARLDSLRRNSII